MIFLIGTRRHPALTELLAPVSLLCGCYERVREGLQRGRFDAEAAGELTHRDGWVVCLHRCQELLHDRRLTIGGQEPVSLRDVVVAFERELGREIPVRIARVTGWPASAGMHRASDPLQTVVPFARSGKTGVPPRYRGRWG